MSETYIGCIDGKVISVRRGKKRIVLTIGAEKARLSREAAALLSNQLTPKARTRTVAKPPQPIQHQPGQVPSLEIDPELTVADLLREGLIKALDVVTLKFEGTTHRAVVTDRGDFDLYGRTHGSPSGAARQVTKKAINGWTAWKVADGRSLHDLRNRFQWLREAERFPDDEHRYATSTLREKRRLANRWVVYALDTGIHPGQHDEEAVEQFLGGHRYSENTLSTYRTHLEQWFDRFQSG